MVDATLIQLAGAAGFGLIIGWYVYYLNRYRKGDVQLSDIVTVIGAIGGAAVLALFPAGTDLFGAYGIGLAIGFFGYLFFLIILTNISKNFNVDWFLDGRRTLPNGQVWVPEMGQNPPGGTAMFTRVNPNEQ